jgi:hypothetical protein
VRAIVEDGRSRIDRLARNTGDLAIKVSITSRRGPRELYCDKAPGQSWLAIPPYALARAVAAGDGPPSPRFLAWSAWLVTVCTVAVPSAIAAVLFALLLGAWGVRAGWACAAAAAWALATLAWPYGTLFYGHQTAAAFLISAMALLAIPRARGEAPSLARLVGVGALLGGAVVIEYPAALAAAAIGGYGLVAFGVRRAAWIVVGAIPPAVALLAYHAIVFDGGFPYDFSNQGNRAQGFFMGIGVPRPTALWHLLISDYRGLFYSAPWLLLAVPGAIVLARSGRRAEVAVCAVIAILFVWLNASLVDWQGGWALGARYLVPSLPFWALLAAGWLVRPPARRPLRRGVAAVALALVAWSGAHMLIGTAVKPEVPVVIAHPWHDFLYPRFGRGELAVSTQGIDQKAPGRERAAWNLGHKAGLGGLGSLAPLVLWSLGCAVLIRHRARGAVLMSERS